MLYEVITDPNNPGRATSNYEIPNRFVGRFNWAHAFWGDNRKSSLDSRTFGAIPKENIIGKVVRVIWPLNAPPLYGR